MLLRRFYDRLPLTDRITFHFDAQAALLVAVFNGAIMRLNYSDRFRSELMGNIRILLGLASAVIAYFSGRFLDHLLTDI